MIARSRLLGSIVELYCVRQTFSQCCWYSNSAMCDSLLPTSSLQYEDYSGFSNCARYFILPATDECEFLSSLAAGCHISITVDSHDLFGVNDHVFESFCVARAIDLLRTSRHFMSHRLAVDTDSRNPAVSELVMYWSLQVHLSPVSFDLAHPHDSLSRRSKR